MAGRIKHIQRSHYSYRNGVSGIYRSFENRAYARSVRNAPGMSLMEKVANAFQKLKLPGFANKQESDD